jgi:molybdopterin-dependent oxidoreductase alpha subunit
LRKPKSAGGWPAIWYSLDAARRSGPLKFWQALRSRNTCRTCALGMGGQRGGMVNELGHFPEVCKKSVQALAADMQPALPIGFLGSHDIDKLRELSSRELEALGRLAHPLVLPAGGRKYKPISWDEALEAIAARLRATEPEEAFFYASGRSSNEAGFLMQLFARIYGTNNVNNCSYYCHHASGVGLTQAFGSGTATVTLEDIESCDLFFLIGGNPASNHPRLIRNLVNLRRRGGRVIVINPVRESGLVKFAVPSDPRSLLFGSEIASQYIQPHIGGDIALLTAIAREIKDLEAIDTSFLAAHSDGSTEFLAHLDSLDGQVLASLSGVPSAEIRAAAETYAQAENVIFGWTMGITHHLHGVDNVRAIANLALLRGMVGKPGAGLLPIRGHSNVQGMGSMGVTPALKDSVLRALDRKLGVTAPQDKGYDTMAAMRAAGEGRVRLAFCLGGNLYAANPDSASARRALNQIDTVVYLSTSLNLGHVHGTGRETYILPVRARDEEEQPTTQESMFNYVRLSDGGRVRHAGTLGEVQIISELATRVLDSSPVDFQALRQHGNIRTAIAEVIPGYERLATIDSTGEEFHVGGRSFPGAVFPTTTGRASFVILTPPAADASDGQLRLMTVRSEGQFNTVVYEDRDTYRGQERRDVILMNQSDIAERGLSIDEPVIVSSVNGRLGPVLVREFDIRAGNAVMYYPEANALTSQEVDPGSGTPAFKSTLITIERATSTRQSRRLQAGELVSAERQKMRAC